MEEECQEENESPVLSRHRSPTFSKEEIKMLVSLIEKYKSVILNKSTNTAACQAKEATWLKITKLFNNYGFKHSRTTDSLRTKWENLKKEARKLTKNLMDIRYTELNALNSQIVSMMCEIENSTGVIALPQDIQDELNEREENMQSENHEDNYDKQSDNSLDGENENGRMNRSLNFSPQECRLLLQCVREEKKSVFCKETNGKAIKLKNRAWDRITESFNKQSPQKRSTKVLRTKFCNMRRMVKSVNLTDYLRPTRHEKLSNESDKDIKMEPLIEYKMDVKSEDDETDNEDIHPNSNDNCSNFAPDPLSTVLNSDSGLGSSSNVTPWNQSEHQEIVKLKVELLNYQMETAKLKRKRIEDLMIAEAAERESRAIETSLRLRAARLEAVAAEMKLSPSHPALRYTAEEARAQPYLQS